MCVIHSNTQHSRNGKEVGWSSLYIHRQEILLKKRKKLSHATEDLLGLEENPALGENAMELGGN